MPLTRKAQKFYKTYFELLGRAVSAGDSDSLEQLGLFVVENHDRFIDLIVDQPSDGYAWEVWRKLIKKYLPNSKWGRSITSYEQPEVKGG